MNTSPDIELLVYGAMLAGLGVLAHRSAPEVGHAVRITGIVGGIAVVSCGLLGFRGFRHRILPISILGVLDLVLLTQTIRAYLEIKDGNDARKPLAVMLTLLFAFGIVQLINLVQAHRNKA